MAFLSGAPLVPCFIERIGGAALQRQPGEPIVVARDVPRDEAIQRAAQAFATQLEARVRRAAAATGITSTATGTRSATTTISWPERWPMDPVSHVIFGRTIVAAIDTADRTRFGRGPGRERASARSRPTSTASSCRAAGTSTCAFTKSARTPSSARSMLGCAAASARPALRRAADRLASPGGSRRVGAISHLGARRAVRRAAAARLAVGRHARSRCRSSRWRIRG